MSENPIIDSVTAKLLLLWNKNKFPSLPSKKKKKLTKCNPIITRHSTGKPT